MKILFVSLPYYGQIASTVELTQALTVRGHQVTYLLPQQYHPFLDGSGARMAAYENHPKMDGQIRNAFSAADRILEGYDLLIYEQFFFPGIHLAQKHHKPAVRVITTPAATHHIMERLVDAPGPLHLFSREWVGRLFTRRLKRQLGIEMETDCWLTEIVENVPDCNLVCTLEEFQPEADIFPKEKFHFVGPMVFQKSETFLIKGSPVVCISMGSMAKVSLRFLKTCIQAFRNQPVQVLLAAGQDIPLSRLGPIPGNFLVKDVLPQVTVLRHTDVFVTGAGMNSISEAMTFGVPMVAIPQGMDQPLNASQVEKLGLGLQMAPEQVTPQALRSAVYTVLKDPAYRKTAEEFRVKAANAPGADGAAWIIEDYFAHA